MLAIPNPTNWDYLTTMLLKKNIAQFIVSAITGASATTAGFPTGACRYGILLTLNGANDGEYCVEQIYIPDTTNAISKLYFRNGYKNWKYINFDGTATKVTA